MHRRSQFKQRLGRGRQSSSASWQRNHPSCAPTPTLLPQFQVPFPSFHFSGYQENRNVPSPTGTPWSNLTRADPWLFPKRASPHTGSTAAPSWDPHFSPPTRGHHHSQDIFAQSCVCCWTARPAEGTWLQPASLGICPNFTLATLSPAAAEHSQCLKLALAITRKLL